MEHVGVKVGTFFFSFSPSGLRFARHVLEDEAEREWQRVCCGGAGLHVPGEAMWFSGHATVAGRRGNNLPGVAGAFPSSVCGFTHASRSCACLHFDSVTTATRHLPSREDDRESEWKETWRRRQKSWCISFDF